MGIIQLHFFAVRVYYGNYCVRRTLQIDIISFFYTYILNQKSAAHIWLKTCEVNVRVQEAQTFYIDLDRYVVELNHL